MELVDASGETLTFKSDNGALMRTIKHADGSSHTARLSLLSQKIGTLSDENGRVVATFRLKNDRMAFDFDDGRSETFTAQADGGFAVTDQAPGGPETRTLWYPRGHDFAAASSAVRPVQATVRKASRLAKRGNPSATSVSIHHSEQIASAGVPHGHPRKSTSQHVPLSEHAVMLAAIPSAIANAPLVHVAPFAALPPMEPVLVRASEVHQIDSDRPSEGEERKSASECLKVESDGAHWGFRNSCVTDIQFAYCVKNGDNRLTACGESVVPGSVPGHGFSALIADLSLKETSASHAFRWVGCIGGAGEVVARLDQFDPPMGRCLHASDLPPGPRRADARS
ncbi:MAG: hypothetical protein JOZ55_04375 [Alphaproteobacteria bacterium]|nr:hypothetical protein [Alphaproteobacteria bacterium]